MLNSSFIFGLRRVGDSDELCATTGAARSDSINKAGGSNPPRKLGCYHIINHRTATKLLSIRLQYRYDMHIDIAGNVGQSKL